MLLAESYEETSEWDGAIRNWEKARENPKATPVEKAKTVYHLAWCSARAHEQEAADLFAEAVALGGGDGQAAGIRLGDLKLDADPAAGVAALDAALQAVHVPDDYRNPLVPLDEVRGIIEKAVRVAKEKANWDLGRKAIEVYGRVAITGKDDELAGQLFDAQAKALTEAAKADLGPNGRALDQQAQEAFRQASAAYVRTAGKAGDPPAQAPHFGRPAISRFKRANPSAPGISSVVSIRRRTGPGKGGRGLAADRQHGPTEPTQCRCPNGVPTLPGVARPVRPQSPARVGQNRTRREPLRPGRQGVAAGPQGSSRSRSNPDAAVQEQALFAWAETAYQRQYAVKDELREYGTATERLRRADRRAVSGRHVGHSGPHHVGIGLLERGTAQRSGPPAWPERTVRRRAIELSHKRTNFLRKSAEQYEKVEEGLLLAQGSAANGRLTTDEAVYLEKAGFFMGECYFWMPRYDETIRHYGTLASLTLSAGRKRWSPSARFGSAMS